MMSVSLSALAQVSLKYGMPAVGIHRRGGHFADNNIA